MALTGGLLIPSQLQKKLYENLEFPFGFANIEFAKFSEHNFKDFIKLLRNSILTNSDLILLFQLDDEVMKQDFDLVQQTKSKTKTSETQTENILANNHVERTKSNNISWNIWDYHRQTIHLANLRQKQTHNTQSSLSYGTRNAQNQCNRKLNIGTQK